MSNASELSQAVNRLVVRLKFIVIVELLCDQAESDFVQCETKMRAFAHRMCSEFKQIELIWNRIVHQNALWSLVFSISRPWNKQISAPDASQPSSQERWQVAHLKAETFEDLWYLFSSEDKYKVIFLMSKGRLTDRLELTTSLSILNGPKSFFVASRLIAMVNEFFKNTGHTG